MRQTDVQELAFATTSQDASRGFRLTSMQNHPEEFIPAPHFRSRKKENGGNWHYLWIDVGGEG